MKNVLKKTGIGVMVLSMFTLSSCDLLEELNRFDFDLEGEEIVIVVDPLEAGSEVVLGSEKFEKTLEDIIKENASGASLDKIKEINLTGLSVEIVSGSDEDNNFQNFSRLYAEVKATGIDGLLVAEKEEISPNETTKMDIPVKGGSVNVKNYFNKTNFEYVVKADVDKETTKELTIKIKANYSFVFSL